jgi:hypothetical protein
MMKFNIVIPESEGESNFRLRNGPQKPIVTYYSMGVLCVPAFAHRTRWRPGNPRNNKTTQKQQNNNDEPER